MTQLPTPDVLAPLANFPLMRQGPAPYFLKQIESADALQRATGWIGVLDARAMRPNLYARLLEDCAFGIVRKRAVSYFASIFEHEMAERAAATKALSIADAAKQAFEARLSQDSDRMALAEIANFLAAGTPMSLNLAVENAEFAGGTEFAMSTALRILAAQPLSAAAILKVFKLAESKRQPELLDRLADLYASTGVFRHIGELTAAIAERGRDNPQGCLDRLDKLESNPAFKNTLDPFKGFILVVRAEALHSIGAYPAAYRAYVEMNSYDAGRTTVRGSDYLNAIEARLRLKVPKLPPEQRTDVVHMLGFPRSGTTLLENVLAAHPKIETFEEIPSHNAAVRYIESVLLKHRPAPADDADVFCGAREAYYREIDIRRRKSEATVLVDKMPIRSSDAALLKRLFPERRYIFSIRHPFDVVLSCFRQRFSPNPAMENFHTIGDASHIYDFTMTQWFQHFSMDDERVCYVKYDELVTSFEPTTRGVLTFLGVDWSDEVHSFAQKAEKRKAATPSYAKVRQGLSIGVQSSWRDYSFAFQTPEAKPLYKWAEFFGYETK